MDPEIAIIGITTDGANGWLIGLPLLKAAISAAEKMVLSIATGGDQSIIGSCGVGLPDQLALL